MRNIIISALSLNFLRIKSALSVIKNVILKNKSNLPNPNKLKKKNLTKTSVTHFFLQFSGNVHNHVKY